LLKTASYFAPGMALAYGHSVDTDPHQHALWQVCLPSDASVLNGQPLRYGTVIKPGELHQLCMPNGWVMLAEPESLLGEAISQLPTRLPFAEPDARLNILLEQLGEFPELVHAMQNNPYLCQDERLSRLLARLDQCFGVDCLKPEAWRAKEVAEWLAMSESRFLHLVKAELGIAWRPYLLWRRLICAIQTIRRGKTATEAAYLAGFSDSSHLSRTIKATFGMTGKQLLNSFRDSG